MDPMPQHDEQDDLSALDFSSHQSGSDDDHDESSALDFSADTEDGEESGVDAIYEYAPTEPEETVDELEAIAAATEGGEEEEEEELGLQQFTVTNPPETVGVSALMDGRTQRVHLAPTATKLSESELAEEIIVLAELARQKGLAGQHSYLMEAAPQTEQLQELGEIGFDPGELIQALVEGGMNLPTPEQADAAQTEVFATRYNPDK
jgi:hypothetical protein